MRILHHWPLDPFSREVRLALAEKALEFETRIEKVWSRPEPLLALNPAGTLP
ncbi:MAG TPA: glutathione S-transferase, partial [Alphaproteobacteria bacterium]|nr:glutathione S-transferase [Alphaproteobacteria bacterium]